MTDDHTHYFYYPKGQYKDAPKVEIPVFNIDPKILETEASLEQEPFFDFTVVLKHFKFFDDYHATPTDIADQWQTFLKKHPEVEAKIMEQTLFRYPYKSVFDMTELTAVIVLWLFNHYKDRPIRFLTSVIPPYTIVNLSLLHHEIAMKIQPYVYRGNPDLKAVRFVDAEEMKFMKQTEGKPRTHRISVCIRAQRLEVTEREALAKTMDATASIMCPLYETKHDNSEDMTRLYFKNIRWLCNGFNYMQYLCQNAPISELSVYMEDLNEYAVIVATAAHALQFQPYLYLSQRVGDKKFNRIAVATC